MSDRDQWGGVPSLPPPPPVPTPMHATLPPPVAGYPGQSFPGASFYCYVVYDPHDQWNTRPDLR